MLPPLKDLMSGAGAVLCPATGRPLHFGAPEAELGAAMEGCALADRSHLGRLIASGPDVLDLLQRLSTADVGSLVEGRGMPAVLLTPKGRIVQRLHVHHLGPTGILLVAGPGGASTAKEQLDRFTFRENTGLRDATGQTGQIVLVGPRAREAIFESGFEVPPPYGSAPGLADGVPIHVLGENGLSGEGFSVVGEARGIVAAWKRLAESAANAGGRAIGDFAFEAWRVLRGLPEAGHELTSEHNPLEAGLEEAISFTKGCYVGQEIVARLNTYDKVSQVLKGLVFPPGVEAPEPGAPLLVDERNVGTITSALVPPGRMAAVALAYVKRREIEGSVEPGAVRIVDLPFGETP